MARVQRNFVVIEYIELVVISVAAILGCETIVVSRFRVISRRAGWFRVFPIAPTTLGVDNATLKHAPRIRSGRSRGESKERETTWRFRMRNRIVLRIAFVAAIALLWSTQASAQTRAEGIINDFTATLDPAGPWHINGPSTARRARSNSRRHSPWCAPTTRPGSRIPTTSE